MSDSWITLFPDSSIKHISDLDSDHRAILYSSSHNAVNPRKYFIYDQRWNELLEISDIVNRTWISSRVKGSYLFQLYKKLMTLRHNLVHRQSNGSSNSQTRISKLKQAISLERASPRRNWDSIRSLETELEIALRSEEAFWKRKARNNWLLNGDRNTRYFQRIASIKRQHNHIEKLTDFEGRIQTEEKVKQEIAISYFQNLFTSELPPGFFPRHLCPSFSAKISSSDNSLLIRPLSLSEIKAATFSIGVNQSPRSDGFNSSFFQKYWNLIKPDLFRAVSSFFSSGIMLKNINHSIISLIPKVATPSAMTQLRPISLYQVIYKIIAKILAARLSVPLSTIIGKHQNGFIKNRQITGNLIVAHEIMHFLRKKKSGNKFYMALKLDMEKAFDRIEWDYLFEALKKLGFHHKFIGWIRSCVTTVTYSINFNGRRCGYFKPSRGLRQGDPLSPLLFAICSEGLSRLLFSAVVSGTLKGIKIGRNAPQISHLFFADDSFRFLEINQAAIRTLKDLFLKFQLFFGQKINFGKSAIFFSQNTPPDVQLRFSQDLGVQATWVLDKYLGLPSLIPKSKKDMFKALEDKLRKRLSGWSSANLSLAGKEVLIKSVASSFPLYAMKCFKLPNSVAINSLIANFWWKSSGKDKPIHWVQWNKLTLPKNKGGLGFRDFRAMNQALLAQQGWELLTNQNSLPFKLLKGKYFPNGNFLTAKLGALLLGFGEVFFLAENFSFQVFNGNLVMVVLSISFRIPGLTTVNQPSPPCYFQCLLQPRICNNFTRMVNGILPFFPPSLPQQLFA
ncbi:LINE-1 retrotransposable element ORF2 protein [Linum grandiflorum]